MTLMHLLLSETVPWSQKLRKKSTGTRATNNLYTVKTHLSSGISEAGPTSVQSMNTLLQVLILYLPLYLRI